MVTLFKEEKMPGVDNATIKRIARLEHLVEDLELECASLRANNDAVFQYFNNLPMLPTNNYRSGRPILASYCSDCGQKDVIDNPQKWVCKKYDCKYGNSIARDME